MCIFLMHAFLKDIADRLSQSIINNIKKDYSMTKKQLLSYGFIGFSKDLLLTFSSGLVILYFTDGLQLAPLFVGSLVFFGRILDALNNIVIAYLLDYLGKSYKKCYLVGIGGALVTFIALYSLAMNSYSSQYTLLIVFLYLLQGIFHTLMDLSYWSTLPKLSKDGRSKKSLSTIATFFSSSSALIGFSLALPLLNFLSKGNLAHGFFTLSYYVSFFVVIMLLISFPYLPSVPSDELTKQKNKDNLNIIIFVKAILKNHVFLRYLTYFFFFQLSFEWMNTFNIYYFKYSINQEHFFSIYALSILAQIFGVGIYPKIAKSIKNEKIVYLAFLLSISGMLCLYVLGRFLPSNAVLMFLAACVKQVGSGLAMVSATAELVHAIHASSKQMGMNHVAKLTSVKLLAAKLTAALSGLGLGMVLSYSGYISNQIQTPKTAIVIGQSTFIIPVFLLFISSYCYYNFVKVREEF